MRLDCESAFAYWHNPDYIHYGNRAHHTHLLYITAGSKKQEQEEEGEEEGKTGKASN